MMTSGSKLYTIEYLKSVMIKDVPSLPKTVKKSIENAISERLTRNPISFGKPLRYGLKGYRSLQVGSYRIIYRIEHSKQIVLITAIKHRKDAYN